MSGGKGGTTTSKVEIPKWLEDAAQSNLAKANEISQIGHTPYFGPDVAALTPLQQASMQNTQQAAQAFGTAAPTDVMAGMPEGQTYAGGVQGYSSAPLYQQALSELQSQMPAQYAALQAPFSNPVTGAAPTSPFGGSYQPEVITNTVYLPANQQQPSGREEAYGNTGVDWASARNSNEYDPYLDPQVVGTGKAFTNSVRSVPESIGNSMGGGK